MKMVQVCSKTNARQGLASPETVRARATFARRSRSHAGKARRQSSSLGVIPRIACQGLPCDWFQRPFEAGYAWRLF
jgi:hypothetical protein